MIFYRMFVFFCEYHFATQQQNPLTVEQTDSKFQASPLVNSIIELIYNCKIYKIPFECYANYVEFKEVIFIK